MPSDVANEASPMAPALDDKIHVFISYAHRDREIAQALYEELSDIDRNRVECFFDQRTIQSGAEWMTILKRELRRSDWLVCVYTGEQSEFCGFEVGYFADSGDTNGLGGRSDKRLVCLHDVDDLPSIYSGYQSRLVTTPLDAQAGNQSSDDSAFFKRAPVTKFLADFCIYRGLYPVRDYAEASRQEASLVLKARRITEAFASAKKDDEKAQTPLQLGIDIRVPKLAGGKMQKVPPAARISGTYESLKLFGLQPPMVAERLPRTTWQDMREACMSSNRFDVLWMDQLQADIVRAANGLAVRAPEATFRSKSNDKIYRPILARHVEYFGGERLFSILFVETLPRQFLGRKNTSMLLAGLVHASRFRFTYLEDHEEVFDRLFGDGVPNDEFENNCRQLKYNIEDMTHEAADFGLIDESSFVKAFGPENRAKAENFLKTWVASQTHLYQRLPDSEARVTDANRAEIAKALAEYFRTVEAVNEKFIVAAIEAFRTEIMETFRPESS